MGDRWWGAGLSRLLVFVRYCWWNPPLRNLGTGIVQKSLVFPAPKMYNIPNMGSAMKSKKQTYFDLIESMINSLNEEAQIAILKAKEKLIDDELADFLRKWATKIIAEKKIRQARDIIINIFNFSSLIGQFPLGKKAAIWKLPLQATRWY